MAMFGLMVDIDTEVEPVIGRQCDVVGPLVDITLLTSVSKVGQWGILCGRRCTVTAVIGPSSIGESALRKAVMQVEVELMAVVKLVIKPAGIIVIELPFVP